MDNYNVFPDAAIVSSDGVSEQFSALGVDTFHHACRYVHDLPYGYNSDRDDLFVLFEEKMGSCTTKHAVIATLAGELNLPVEKNIGIYAMTEAMVTGTDAILARYGLPYVPMIHCFLGYGQYRVDLTDGNANGKNRSVTNFLYVEPVIPNISARDEYLKYRQALKEHILKRTELAGVEMKTILHAREEGIALLKSHV
ncbi:hypothetical protein DSCA_23570 [Desulfosarcina alkanivorans]|uniref:Transglutaminase-like domain-containing protein n=1 Tax=Desulfosarcina alkanivorans TaxID=571177 RepID=A0A5K7YUS1_9BACT|nr:hypothetical protein [Desulfosarcina alkanivorans]BBO68427.1 hypothetical protein DSCA_23570 [Desulfosarcina alkanivorans]